MAYDEERTYQRIAETEPPIDAGPLIFLFADATQSFAAYDEEDGWVGDWLFDDNGEELDDPPKPIAWAYPPQLDDDLVEELGLEVTE